MNLLRSEGIEEVTEDSSMNMSDAVLVSTAKAGDANAFVELSKRHSAVLLRTGLSHHQELARCGRRASGLLSEGFRSSE